MHYKWDLFVMKEHKIDLLLKKTLEFLLNYMISKLNAARVVTYL